MSSSLSSIDDGQTEEDDDDQQQLGMVMVNVSEKSLRELLNSKENATKKLRKELRKEKEKSKSLKRKLQVFMDKAAAEESSKVAAMERRFESLENAGTSRLWDAIVKNDDISFVHILPKLNGTDIKFFYGTNTEARALVKRSSRREELRTAFKVEEMSSISTLELAWEGQSMWNETEFCEKVAKTHKLEFLKWIREEKKCEWDARTINAAARHGDLEMLKYCVANQCPVDVTLCGCAAQNGHLECLKYLHEEAKVDWGILTATCATLNGHLHILEYLVERKYGTHEWPFCCVCAAEKGHLDCLKFLRETARARWDEDAVRQAHENNHPECLQYLLDNDCPLPDGWRYEDGTLYTD